MLPQGLKHEKSEVQHCIDKNDRHSFPRGIVMLRYLLRPIGFLSGVEDHSGEERNEDTHVHEHKPRLWQNLFAKPGRDVYIKA